MNSSWTKTSLGNLKPSAFTEDQVRGWHSHLSEINLHVAVRRVIAEDHQGKHSERHVRGQMIHLGLFTSQRLEAVWVSVLLSRSWARWFRSVVSVSVSICLAWLPLRLQPYTADHLRRNSTTFYRWLCSSWGLSDTLWSSNSHSSRQMKRLLVLSCRTSNESRLREVAPATAVFAPYSRTSVTPPCYPCRGHCSWTQQVRGKIGPAKRNAFESHLFIDTYHDFTQRCILQVS